MDRKDGTRVTNEEPMYYLVPQFLTRRYDAMNMITVDIPVDPLRAYMNEKRKEGIRLSHLALIITAYIRAVGKFPALNRFIVNKRIYQRNELCASMVVLRPGGNGDTFSKLYFDPSDTVFDVQRKIDDFISAGRNVEEDNGLDRIMQRLIKMSGLMSFACSLLRWADNHNLLPKAIIKVSPFHTSFLISNLASIRTNHIYHHVYDFGTTSIGITMGNMRDVPHQTANGIVLERCIPLGIVMDERICSGHYFAKVFEFMKQELSDPSLMEA